MTTDLFSAVEPPDETGTDVFRRFRYQAHVAFPYCLRCGLSQEAGRVVLEHFEDFAVDSGSRVLFVQVKTRNASLGAWTLSRVIESGAFQSLIGTFDAVANFRGSSSLLLVLEGAIASTDTLSNWQHNRSSCVDRVCDRIASVLGRDVAEVRSFLLVLDVHVAETRDSIRAINIQILSSHAPRAAAATIEAVYDNIIDDVSRAMSGEALGVQWPEYMHADRGLTPQLVARVAAKTVGHEEIRRRLALVVGHVRTTLQPDVTGEPSGESNLRQKLEDGGASANTVAHAQVLRAQAAIRDYEILSSGAEAEIASLQDVQQRILMRCHAILAEIGEGRHAERVWGRIWSAMLSEHQILDDRSVYRDPLLLIGALCELSDQCRFRWHRAV